MIHYKRILYSTRNIILKKISQVLKPFPQSELMLFKNKNLRYVNLEYVLNFEEKKLPLFSNK